MGWIGGDRGMPAGAGVSAREAEVLAALAKHLTNAEIAALLFISIRTVESHVSSLLRKLQANDRRALAVMASTVLAGPEFGPGPPEAASRLPPMLTSFVGRATERAALADALGGHRLVTVAGPGGVGNAWRCAWPLRSPPTSPTAPGSSIWHPSVTHQ